jgi:hypothetical protein
MAQSTAVRYHFAELNIARTRFPLDHPEMAEFVAVLDAINRVAEVSPGFVWRLQDDEGNSSSYVAVFDDPQWIVNLTVWETYAHLRHYLYRSGHGAYFRRRSEWFEPHQTHDTVCWWIPIGQVPTVEDALRRLDRLRAYGPSAEGFGLANVADYALPPQ